MELHVAHAVGFCTNKANHSADWLRFAKPIDRFVKDGLLERDGALLRLTGPGVLLSNEVFQEFVS